MGGEIVFDKPEYARIDKVREDWLATVLALLPFRAELVTALDLGCGAGYFSKVLHRAGFSVTGLDLRMNNIDLCRRRYPECTFGTIDLDDTSQLIPEKIGRFDMVLMFGLLYHLQSPLQVISRLAPCIGRVAIVETRVAAGDALACYLHREFAGDDQNTASIVAVPTFSALVTMFASFGLPYAYLPDFQPCHEQWDPEQFQNGLRKQFVVCRRSIAAPGLLRVEAKEPTVKWQPIVG
jgi:SAM-dependent methyltransferase